MHTGEQYQRMATECLRLARIVRDDKDKLMLLKMVQTWAKLAKRLKEKLKKRWLRWC